MSKDLIIRQASMEDLPSVANFYEAAFDNTHFKYTERFIWLYQNNPFFISNRFLPIWLAINREKVIGMTCMMPHHFWVKQNTLVGAISHDTRLLPECRGMGVGSQLLKQKHETGNNFSVEPADAIVHIYKKLGYSFKHSVVTYLNVRRFFHKFLFDDLCRYLRISKNSRLYNAGLKIKIPEIISMIMVTLFKAKQKKIFFMHKNKETELTFKSVDFFSEQVDELWDEIKTNYSFAVVRDSKYLNWKFVSQPHLSYQKYLVYKSSKLCGVLIFRCGHSPELPIGIISEYYTNQGSEVLSQMVNFAVNRLYLQGSLMVRCASSSTERSKVLSNLNFVPVRRHLSAFSFSPDNNTDCADINVRGDWLLGFGDGDFDAYGTASHPSLGTLLKILFTKAPKSRFN